MSSGRRNSCSAFHACGPHGDLCLLPKPVAPRLCPWTLRWTSCSDRVGEVHRAALGVVDLALVQNLQQDIHDVRMCWGFVKTARRCTDGGAPSRSAARPRRSRHSEGEPIRRDTAYFSIYSLMSMEISGSTVSNSWFASCLTSSVLPTPVGADEVKLAGRWRPNGPPGRV